MRTITTLVCGTALWLAASPVRAHVSVGGTGFANANFEASFNVGHGCAGADTARVRIVIPDGVTSIRPVNGELKATVEKNPAGAVTAVVFTKAAQDVQPSDTHYYKLVVRMKLPNTPFATLYFPATQTCRDANGLESTVPWVGTAEQVAAVDAGVIEPAPSLVVLPPRVPGWNKFVVTQALTSLSIFNDALIVWSGTAAYSNNPNTKALIEKEPGTTLLTTLPPGSEVWVRY